jgi:hypothetical protein
MNNPMTMLQEIKSNPMGFLMQRKFNVPADIASDPQAIINHLLKTGQVSQDAVNRAYQQMGQFKR